MLTKTVQQSTTAFVKIHHVASLAQDGTDYASCSTIEALFEVDTPICGSNRCCPSRKVTGALPGSVARVTGHIVLNDRKKCPWHSSQAPGSQENPSENFLYLD